MAKPDPTIIRSVSADEIATLTISVYGEDYDEVHLDGWTYQPGTRASLFDPGDPPQITLTCGWVTGDTQTRDAASLETLLYRHFELIAEALAEREEVSDDHDQAYDNYRDDDRY